MAREKFHTLTEQMFYVLLCLDEECCGTDILDRVPSMTGGRVTVGSGTLYNLLEQFSEAGMQRWRGDGEAISSPTWEGIGWTGNMKGSALRPGITRRYSGTERRNGRFWTQAGRAP